MALYKSYYYYYYYYYCGVTALCIATCGKNTNLDELELIWKCCRRVPDIHRVPGQFTTRVIFTARIAMHFSAKRGIAIVYCPSVRLSVCDIQVP